MFNFEEFKLSIFICVEFWLNSFLLHSLRIVA